MVFQVPVLLFHIVLLRCCLSRPNLRPNFAKLIEQGAYRLKNSQISPSWAVYCVEDMVNVSIPILLCRVPSYEEAYSKIESAYPSGTFRSFFINGDQITLW